jgi:CRP-like cAMP-binding protein
VDAKLATARFELNKNLTELPLENLRRQKEITKRKLDETTLKAPCRGEILQLFASAGEIVGGAQPILQFADTLRMAVVAEVYETDVYVDYTLTICTFLRKCPLFAGLTADALIRLAEKMGTERFAAGAPIIRQRDHVGERDKFYVLRRGNVDVYVENADTRERRLVNTMTEGNHFGEIALVTGGERTATVVARDDVETWTLDKANFHAALASSESFKDQIQKVLFQRQ